MDSPLILLVFWFVINLLIKSSKDKKKIEEARRKKSQQIDNRPLQNQSTISSSRDINQKNTNKSRNIMDVLKEEIEREVQREKEVQRGKQVKPKVSETKIAKSNTGKTKVADKEAMVLDAFQENPTIDEPIIAATATRSNGLKLDIKKDLLKGFIYSEILSEPKSIRNTKRSM